MERAYELTIDVGGHDRKREKEIIKACLVEWNFREEDFFHHPASDGKGMILEASAVGVLYGDDDKDEFGQRLSRAVWRANGGLCHVEVRAMDLKSMKSDILGWNKSGHESVAA